MRRSENSTLAFLDVMACGLGAVILILVVLKQQAPIDTPSQNEKLSGSNQMEASIDNLQNELAILLSAQDIAKSDLEQQQKIVASISAMIEKKNLDLKKVIKKGSELDQAITKTRNDLVQNKIATPPEPKATILDTQPKYVVGLKVIGKKIVILLDRSASMTARKLLNIIQYKAGTSMARRNAEKWVRALDAVWWLVARAPADSLLQIASFSNTTTFHTNKWTESNDVTSIAVVRTEMRSLIPEGSTNLETAIRSAIEKGADSIYVITDGLPTSSPAKQSILGLDGCSSKLSKKKQVTGKCRISLFKRTAAVAAGKPVRISVVLMPLEGDPDAAPLFSKWALSKGGTMLSAAKDWP